MKAIALIVLSSSFLILPNNKYMLSKTVGMPTLKKPDRVYGVQF